MSDNPSLTPEERAARIVPRKIEDPLERQRIAYEATHTIGAPHLATLIGDEDKPWQYREDGILYAPQENLQTSEGYGYLPVSDRQREWLEDDDLDYLFLPEEEA